MNNLWILSTFWKPGYVEIQRIHSRGLESDGLAGVLGVLMTGEMNILLIEAVVKGYHECPFTVRTGEHFVIDKKTGDRGEAFRVVTL